MMFKRVLLLVCLVAVMVSPVLAAGMPFDKTYTSSYSTVATVMNPTTGVMPYISISGMIIGPSLGVPEFLTMFTQLPSSLVTNYNSLPSSTEARVDICYSSQTGSKGALWSTGTYGYFKYTSGSKSYLQVWIEVDDPQPLTSARYLKFFLQDGQSMRYPVARHIRAEPHQGLSWIYNSLTTDVPGVKGTFAGNCKNDYGTNFFTSLGGQKSYPVLSGSWRNQLKVSAPVGSDAAKRVTVTIDKTHPGYNGLSDHVVAFGETAYTVLGTSSDIEYVVMADDWPFTVGIRDGFTDTWHNETFGAGTLQPCTINVYDADTRLPLSGSWNYYIVMRGYDSLNESASGASAVVNLPVTSILQPHRLRVTKEGYVQVPENLAFDVPAGGREIPVYLRSTTAPPEEGNVWLGFTCTDADTGSPVPGALVNLDGSAQYTPASGYVRFQVPMNSTHKWVASSSSHWPMGGDITVTDEDVTVLVELVRKTSDLPRPPLPELPNFPVIHPSLDPAGFRMKILDVPILGDLASPILDTMDAIAVGLDDIARPVLDFATAPADSVVQVLEGVGDQLTSSVGTYTSVASVLLGAVGKLLAAFPPLVIGLVSYNLVLDLVYLLLRGGL